MAFCLPPCMVSEYCSFLFKTKILPHILVQLSGRSKSSLSPKTQKNNTASFLPVTSLTFLEFSFSRPQTRNRSPRLQKRLQACFISSCVSMVQVLVSLTNGTDKLDRKELPSPSHKKGRCSTTRFLLSLPCHESNWLLPFPPRKACGESRNPLKVQFFVFLLLYQIADLYNSSEPATLQCSLSFTKKNSPQLLRIF